MRKGLAYFGCCVVGLNVYVIGGLESAHKATDDVIAGPEDAHKATEDVEIYDIKNETWKIGPSLPIKISGFEH